MENKKEEVKKVTEKLAEQNEIEKTEELLKNNFIPFKIGEIEYRVRKPNYNERTSARVSRTKKYVELLQEKGWLLRDTLIKVYKEKQGVDIPDMERTIKKYTYKIKESQKKLATTTDKEGIAVFEEEIKRLEDEQEKIINKKAELLEYCIEEELAEYSNLYLLCCVLEKEISSGESDKKYEKVFKDFDNFMKTDNDELVIKGASNLSLLLFTSKI